jgi:hypothetical protein
MRHVKQHTHLIGEVRGEDKNTYECVLKQNNFSSERGGENPLRVGCYSGWTRLPFSTQAKAHFVGFCRLIRSYAVRLSCQSVATESLSQPFQGSHNSDIK